MCGINGFNWADEEKIKSMNSALNHRGPDGTGTYFQNDVSLGHVRLSILDLSEKGHQPMGLSLKPTGQPRLIYKDEQLQDADLIIVYNGEIYNYIELKQQLDKYNFESDCDTEVILKSYLEWGENCVSKFNGIWSFVIYDKTRNVFFCSKDRFGEKPFYYYFNELTGKFIFSSELKAILQHDVLKINSKNALNHEAIQFYFAMGYIPAPITIFQNVYKLEGSQNLIFNLTTKKIEKKYYYYELPPMTPLHDRKALVEEGKKLLDDAVKIRMRSDVPVGAYLSGGLDSSSVVITMRKYTELAKLHTFSVGFEGSYDETHYIKLIADQYNTNHHHHYFYEKDLADLLDPFSFAYDEPFGDYSGYPTLFISKHAKENITVVLSGDGGDEVFGGYDTYKLATKLNTLYKIPRFIRQIIAKMPDFSLSLLKTLKFGCKISLAKKEDFLSISSEHAYSPQIYKEWTREKMKVALEKAGDHLGEAHRVFDVLYNTFQDRFCVKVDRGSMRYALEVRAPLMDYRLVEFAQKIPTKWKLNQVKTKILMRDIIKGLVPDEIVNRGKHGFTPPLTDWITGSQYAAEINDGLAFLRDIDVELYEFYQNQIMGSPEEYAKVYKIYLFIFARWYKKWCVA